MIDDTAITHQPIAMTWRRLKLSAMAPAKIDRTNTGSVVEVCIRATITSEVEMVAISQVTATVWNSQPRHDTCAASQITRKVGFSSGANVADETEAASASARATLLIGPSLSFRVEVKLEISPLQDLPVETGRIRAL